MMHTPTTSQGAVVHYRTIMQYRHDDALQDHWPPCLYLHHIQWRCKQGKHSRNTAAPHRPQIAWQQRHAKLPIHPGRLRTLMRRMGLVNLLLKKKVSVLAKTLLLGFLAQKSCTWPCSGCAAAAAHPRLTGSASP